MSENGCWPNSDRIIYKYILVLSAEETVRPPASPDIIISRAVLARSIHADTLIII